jgi:hypothetical protein
MLNKLSAAFVAMSLIAAAQPASAQTVVKFDSNSQPSEVTSIKIMSNNGTFVTGDNDRDYAFEGSPDVVSDKVKIGGKNSAFKSIKKNYICYAYSYTSGGKTYYSFEC